MPEGASWGIDDEASGANTPNGDNDPHGRLGDLKLAEVKDASGATIDTSYYRYYKFTGEGDALVISKGPTNQHATTGGPAPVNPAYGYDPNNPDSYNIFVQSGLKSVTKGASFDRLAAAVTSYESASDGAIEPYVNNYFEYERWADHFGTGAGDNWSWRTGYRLGTRYRVTKEIAQGAGCSTCTGGQGTSKIDYAANYNPPGTESGIDSSGTIGFNKIDYNVWRMRTTEYLPDTTLSDWTDNDRSIVYTNEVGLPMLSVLVDANGTSSTSDDKVYSTYFRYDEDGRLLLRAHPSAVAQYVPPTSPTAADGSGFESNLDLVGFNGTSYANLNDSTGLIEVTGYYNATTATASVAGGVDGYIWYRGIRRGEQGNQKSVSSLTQSSGTATATVSAHGYSVGDIVEVRGADTASSLYNGSFVVTAVTTDTFSFAVSTSAPTTATGTIKAEKIALIAKHEYLSRTGAGLDGTLSTADDTLAYPLASYTVYRHGDNPAEPHTDTGNAQVTQYSYTWVGNSAQMQSMTVEYPSVTTAQNGPNSADTETSFFDIYGRVTWHKDGDGFITHMKYDADTGGVIEHIADVNTATTADEPSGWTTPSGGGLHLVTAMEVDGLGRTTKLTDPNDNVTYTVYQDADREVRVYRGWQSATNTTTGPVEVTREYRQGTPDADGDGRVYAETLAFAPGHIPVDAAGGPTGQDDTSRTDDDITAANIQWLTRSLTNNADQVVKTDAYFSLAGVTYSQSAAVLGSGSNNSSSGNYHRTFIDYDGRGRLKRTETAGGTITRTLYDARGLMTSTWVGTDDKDDNLGDGETFWSLATISNSEFNLVPVAMHQYDGNADGGDGNLTQTASFTAAARGKATGGTTTTLVDTGRTEATGAFVGRTLYIVAGTGAGQSANVTGFNGTTKTFTLSPALAVAPDSTSVYFAADERVATYHYDWRNRFVSAKQGVGASESTSLDTQRQITYRTLDNLGQFTAEERYDGDDVRVGDGDNDGIPDALDVNDADGVPDRIADGNRRAKTSMEYDEQGRLFRSTVHSVNQSTGATTSGGLATDYWYDRRGNIIKSAQPGGLVMKMAYDGAGRTIKSYATDGGGDTVYGDADDATNDMVLEQTEYAYDGNGNLVHTISKQRAHDYTGTGELPGATLHGPRVVGRHIFYNNSSFDGNDTAANSSDDAAIAADKTALLPGKSRSFANFTTYSRGINGIMVDVKGLANGGSLSASDFEFKIGNNNDPSTWVAAPTPVSVTVRAGAGVGGSDRVTITWADDSITGRWVQVAVKATANTGLATPDVFYFGNLIGDVNGDSEVVGNDVTSVNSNESASAVDVTSRYDVDRSGVVDATDTSITRSNQGFVLAFLSPLTAARASHNTSYYDDSDRLVADVTIGTNGGIPFARPAEPSRASVSGTASSAGSYTTLIDTGRTEPTGSFVGYTLSITSGTGAGQSALVTAYDGATKRFTLASTLISDATSAYTVTPNDLITTYAYDTAGRLSTATDPNAIEDRTTYDMLGRSTKVVEAYVDGTSSAGDDRTTEYTYTGSGNVLTMKAVLPSSAFQETKYVYGEADKSVSGITRSSSTATATSTAHGYRVGESITVTGATETEYNGTFVITAVTSNTFSYAVTGTPATPATGTITVRRAHDVYSNDVLTAVQYPDKSSGSASASEQETFALNALGERKYFMDRNGSVHGYTYDVLGRLTSDEVTTLGTGVDGAVRKLGFTYDTAGRPEKFTSYNSTGGVVNEVQRAYNGLGQLITEYQEHSGAVNTSTSPKVQYGYTELSGGNHSRLTSVTYPNGRIVRHEYSSGLDDTISRLSFLADDSSGAVGTHLEEYSYLGLGTVIKRAHPQGGVDLTYIKQGAEGNGDAGDQYTGLDRFGRVVDQRWRNTSDGSHADRFAYGYDRNSNRLYEENLVDSTKSELYHGGSGYDPLDRLTSFSRGTLDAEKDGISGTPSRSQGWSLDALGNWSAVSTDGTNQTRSHNQQNQLTQAGSSSLAFDANGNTTTDDVGRTMAYDAWNRLASVTPSGGSATTYAYDALGRRIKESPGGGTARDLYHSNQWQVLEERESGSAKTQYVWSPVYVDAMVLRDQLGTGTATTAAGSLDTSFSSDGKVTINAGAVDDELRAIVQTNGKIVVAGSTGGDVALARFNTDGTLDTTFGTNGMVVTNFGATNDKLGDLVLQSDGKIVITGSSGGDLLVARYTSSGSLDTTFNTNGYRKQDFNGSSTDRGNGVEVQSDGKIIVTGRTGSNVLVARFTSAGALDTTYNGTSGYRSENFGGTEEGLELALDSSGRAVVAGKTNAGTGDVLVMRLTTGGALDTTFSGDGKLTTDLGASNDDASAIVIDSSGRILVAGFGAVSGNYNFAVVRYLSDGSLDTNFDTDGKAYVDFGGGIDYGEDLLLDSSGRLVLVGSSGNGADFAVARLSSNGSLDTSFDGDGKVTVDFGSTDEMAFALALQTDGKVLAAGRSGGDFAVARLHAETTTTSGDVRHYVQHDANFNVTAITDSTGTVVERYLYDPYGAVTVLDANWAADADGASDVAWVYLHQDGRYDAATGLYHFRNRDYSPTLGRWVQQDPVGYVDGVNLYEFAGTAPLTNIDPLGTDYTNNTGQDQWVYVTPGWQKVPPGGTVTGDVDFVWDPWTNLQNPAAKFVSCYDIVHSDGEIKPVYRGTKYANGFKEKCACATESGAALAQLVNGGWSDPIAEGIGLPPGWTKTPNGWSYQDPNAPTTQPSTGPTTQPAR
ncbi:MAG TPA: RHS repeat-associated core domain-containing protein [Tepidisphaeraceae bacterium]|nr:RHS repeat-associated core domain-containing protein [Tepidisphaeraceae bacterium]